jgi:hypothetical protein
MAKIEWRLNVQDSMAQKSGGKNRGKILGQQMLEGLSFNN